VLDVEHNERPEAGEPKSSRLARLQEGDPPARQADLTVTCGTRVTGDNRPSSHIVPERALDLGHASARAEERQLDFFVVVVGGGLTGFVDLRV